MSVVKDVCSGVMSRVVGAMIVSSGTTVAAGGTGVALGRGGGWGAKVCKIVSESLL